jgi:hypothetical protein
VLARAKAKAGRNPTLPLPPEAVSILDARFNLESKRTAITQHIARIKSVVGNGQA